MVVVAVSKRQTCKLWAENMGFRVRKLWIRILAAACPSTGTVNEALSTFLFSRPKMNILTYPSRVPGRSRGHDAWVGGEAG